MHLKAGAKVASQTFPNTFLYALTDGALVFSPPGRTPYELTFKAGEALWLSAQQAAMANETGKDLYITLPVGASADYIRNLANLIRQRQAFRGEVATLTAEPKLSARVLAALPIVAFLMINFLNPDLTRALYETEAGKYLVIYAATSVVIGYLIMMKIADVEY